MKKLFLLLAIALFSLSPGYSSQDNLSQTRHSTIISAKQKNHLLKKVKKRGWKDREAHPDSKGTNRIAYLSFWAGLGAFILIAVGLAVPAFIAALVSAPLGLLAWRRRPSKTLAQVASVLGIALGFGFIVLVIVAIVALFVWLLGL